MADKLTDRNQMPFKGERLANVKQMPFKISIDHSLENGYCFKDLKDRDIKNFHNFIESTVGKELTITEVETLFRRNRGPKDEIKIRGSSYELIHLGKDKKPFRVFGYFSNQYFVLYSIDPKHNKHKS